MYIFLMRIFWWHVPQKEAAASAAAHVNKQELPASAADWPCSAASRDSDSEACFVLSINLSVSPLSWLL